MDHNISLCNIWTSIWFITQQRCFQKTEIGDAGNDWSNLFQNDLNSNLKLQKANCSWHISSQGWRNFSTRLSAKREGSATYRSSLLFHDSSEIRNTKRQPCIQAAFCPNPKWCPCFYYEQLSIPIEDGSANFKFLALSRLNECSRFCTALPIYNNFRRPSLNGVTTTHVSATSATITATMNHVPTIRSATTKCHNSSLVETKQLELNKRRWFQAFCIPQKWFR